MSKRLEIDACIGSELRDSQGETLSVEGANIDDLVSGGGRWNDNHGKGFFNSLGRVTKARKIMKAEDAISDREKYYWDKVKSPYIYAKGYLYNDDEDHLNAKAAAAILKNIHKTDAPLRIKASVEGGVVSRGIKDPSYLARTNIHSVALTFTPANSATLVEPLNLNKSDTTTSDDILIKSVLSLAKDDVPSFIDISDKIRMHKINNNVKNINKLVKQAKYNTNLSTGNIERNKSKRAVDNRVAIGSLAAQPVINLSDKPKLNNNATKVKSSAQWQKDNTIKTHAARAMKDDNYLPTVANSLKDKGHPEEHIDKIIGKIKSHIKEPSGGLSYEQHAQKSDQDSSYIKGHIKELKSGGYSDDHIRYFLKRVAKHKNKKIEKAMAAGYAGSGSPMQHTGGSVMQSESIEGFKYTTCDNCGYEQIYMGNQVKCRKCSKNYSLKKLYSIMGI